MDDRLPAHLEIAGLIRAVESQGGFATVLAKGERDAGTILLVTRGPGEPTRLFERMPQRNGSRAFTVTREENPDNLQEFNEYLTMRCHQDPDIWILELDIAGAERFAALQHK